MTFDTDAVQTQKNPTIIAARVNLALEALHRAKRQQAANNRKRVGFNHLLKVIIGELAHAFRGFEHDVPGVAITHNHIDRAHRDIIPFDKTMVMARKIHAGKYGRCAADMIRALGFLRTDIEQADGRCLNALVRPGKNSAQNQRIAPGFPHLPAHSRPGRE